MKALKRKRNRRRLPARMGGIISSLEVGKRADLVVLDQNLFEIDSIMIHESNVILTMRYDELVHQEVVDWEPPGDPLQFDAYGTYAGR